MSGYPLALVFKALADNITSGDPAIQVALNAGAGFLAAQPWNGALPVPIQSRSGVYRNLGLHFSIAVIAIATGHLWSAGL